MTWSEAEPDDPGGGDEQIMKRGVTNPSKKMGGPTHREDDLEETEDEEVKVNCIGGLSGVHNPDTSEEDSDDDYDASEVDEMESNTVTDESREIEGGVVQFGMNPQPLADNLQRPRAEYGFLYQQNQSIQEDDDDDGDVSDMDESSDSSTCGARGVAISLETGLEESGEVDDESKSDSSEDDNEEGEISSAGGIAGSAGQSGASEEDDEGQEGPSYDAENEVSDGGSETSVPLTSFKNVDSPSDVAELETALKQSMNNSEETPSQPSGTSLPSRPSALMSEIRELEPRSPASNALTHAKRVLSSSALLGRAASSGPQTLASPKRVCRFGTDAESLPEMRLGDAADDRDPEIGLSIRDDLSNPIVSPLDEMEQDRQLCEELEEAGFEEESVSTPIPLLTPPASPVRVEDEEGTTEVCEWPSNLVVDVAMVAANELRPPSPDVLQTWEQEEEERFALSGIELTPDTSPEDEVPLSTTLTPMLRGISVQVEAPYLQL